MKATNIYELMQLINDIQLTETTYKQLIKTIKKHGGLVTVNELQEIRAKESRPLPTCLELGIPEMAKVCIFNIAKGYEDAIRFQAYIKRNDCLEKWLALNNPATNTVDKIRDNETIEIPKDCRMSVVVTFTDDYDTVIRTRHEVMNIKGVISVHVRPVETTFRWGEGIQTKLEYMIETCCATTKVREVEGCIKSFHNYTTPEIRYREFKTTTEVHRWLEDTLER